VRPGCEIGGRGEADAVFEVPEEAVQFESVSADKTAGVFGIAEIKFSRSVRDMLQNPHSVVIEKS
jgi:hypothetical protein